MANSIVTTAITTHHAVGKWQLVVGTLAVGAGDYPSGGLTVNFANTEIKSSLPPITGFIGGIAGYIYNYIPGATKNIGKLKILQAPAGHTAPLDEVTTSTPGGVVSDSIYFFALFPLLR